MTHEHPQVSADEWVSFPGGELEGQRPRAMCAACREALGNLLGKAARPSRPSSRSARPLCFQCYRAGLDRDRKLREAGQLDTASPARFQTQLPFEPVNRPRLEMLKAERAGARAAASVGAGQYADRRRRAQIEARHALQRIVSGLRARALAPADRDRALAAVMHAAELQFPDAWLPFVAS